MNQWTNESERAGRRRRRLTETIKIDPVGDHPRSHKERRISFLSVPLVHKVSPFHSLTLSVTVTGLDTTCHVIDVSNKVWAIGLTRE